ncbi:hypothetical protein [Stutzerimonas nitrititolerans]|uniref:hypothetical protein n=1 Tax=Stutzerimonas nitrititolerans TaxID=2482751 RepID=UPI003F7D0C82
MLPDSFGAPERYAQYLRAAEITEFDIDTIPDLDRARQVLAHGWLEIIMHNDPIDAAKKNRLAILYQLPESWANVRSVWEAAQEDDTVEVSVVLLPFIHRDYQWQRELAEAYLRNIGVPFVPWDAYSLDEAALDAVLYTSPYDETRPEAYKFANLRQHVRRTAYVPYGLEVGGGEQNYVYQYGQPVTARADAVFVRSESVRGMFSRHCPTGSSHVYVTGHPRMDGLVNIADFAVDPALKHAVGERKAILWNAHFSFDGDLWSTFDCLASGIIESFIGRPDLVLLFRPHPLLWKKLINLNILSERDIVELKAQLQECGVIVDERSDHRHAFAVSAAMMSDAGSFLMEYLATGKPVLYLKNPDGLGLNEEGVAVARQYQSASDVMQVDTFLDQVRRGEDPLYASRNAAIKHFFHELDGGSGRRVLNVLKELMA